MVQSEDKCLELEDKLFKANEVIREKSQEVEREKRKNLELENRIEDAKK